jgi:hypothetical integral membrane protein (TIGR02206 family)
MLDTLAAAPSVPTDIMSTFQPFTAFHVVTVVICFALMAAASGLGRTWRSTPRERAFCNSWAFVVLTYQIVVTIYWMMPSRFELDYSLPLQLCDLAAFVAPLALLTQNRKLRTLLYFWGIGLSTQAFLTPILTTGLGTLHYWFFWIGHVAIVGSAIYDVAVRGYRPTLKDLVFASGFSIALTLTMVVVNIALDSNYLYVGNTNPENPTIVDSLGPWPFRILPMMALGLTVFVIIYAVWPIARKLTKAAPPETN